jgi:hypothetical protein
MDEDFQAFVVYHVVQNLSCFKELFCQVLLVEVMDWIVNKLNSFVLVVLLHFGPLNTTVVDVDFSLNTEYTCDTCCLQEVDVKFSLRIRADKNICVINFAKDHACHEVCIYLFNVTIYHEDKLFIPPFKSV